MQAFDKWRAGHLRTALVVRRALETPSTQESELRVLVAAAQNDLWAYFQLKRAVLSGWVACRQGIVRPGRLLLQAARQRHWQPPAARLHAPSTVDGAALRVTLRCHCRHRWLATCHCHYCWQHFAVAGRARHRRGADDGREVPAGVAITHYYSLLLIITHSCHLCVCRSGSARC